MTQKWTPFRAWVHQLWVDNCEERVVSGDSRLDERDYFLKFRWWLRREYRHQLAKEQKMQQKKNQIWYHHL